MIVKLSSSPRKAQFFIKLIGDSVNLLKYIDMNISLIFRLDKSKNMSRLRLKNGCLLIYHEFRSF